MVALGTCRGGACRGARCRGMQRHRPPARAQLRWREWDGLAAVRVRFQIATASSLKIVSSRWPDSVSIKSEFVVAVAQVLNERMPATDHLGAAEPLQAAHRTGPGLQPAVIGFDRVVGVLLDHVPRVGNQLVEHPWVGRRPVGRDLGRPSRPVQGSGEEPAGCLSVPRTLSHHAACTYSCSRPPSRSRRNGRLAAPEGGGVAPAGGR
jgi:hypothetical protein